MRERQERDKKIGQKAGNRSRWTEAENTRWWSQGSCPTGHKSQELRKAFGGSQSRERVSFSLPCCQSIPWGGGLNSRSGWAGRGGQVRRAVTQQPSLSLDRGGHRWRRGQAKKEPVLNN